MSAPVCRECHGVLVAAPNAPGYVCLSPTCELSALPVLGGIAAIYGKWPIPDSAEHGGTPDAQEVRDALDFALETLASERVRHTATMGERADVDYLALIDRTAATLRCLDEVQVLRSADGWTALRLLIDDCDGQPDSVVATAYADYAPLLRRLLAEHDAQEGT